MWNGDGDGECYGDGDDHAGADGDGDCDGVVELALAVAEPGWTAHRYGRLVVLAKSPVDVTEIGKVACPPYLQFSVN